MSKRSKDNKKEGGQLTQQAHHFYQLKQTYRLIKRTREKQPGNKADKTFFAKTSR